MASDRRPSGYRDQDGCHNCRYVCAVDDYDDPTAYYCEHGAPPRPPHGGIDERFSRPITDLTGWTAFSDAWRKWREGREVQAYGVCPDWRGKP